MKQAKDAPSGTAVQLEFEPAFDAFKFYEDAASTVKGRTWAISAWILTVNSGLFAFIFDVGKTSQPKPLIVAACPAGIALCAFLFVLVLDQGGHLQWYWSLQDRTADANPQLCKLTQPIKVKDQANSKDTEKDWVSCLLRSFSARQRKRYEETGKPFPRFCGRLLLLSLLYAGAFAITILVR